MLKSTGEGLVRDWNREILGLGYMLKGREERDHTVAWEDITGSGQVEQMSLEMEKGKDR